MSNNWHFDYKTLFSHFCMTCFDRNTRLWSQSCIFLQTGIYSWLYIRVNQYVLRGSCRLDFAHCACVCVSVRAHICVLQQRLESCVNFLLQDLITLYSLLCMCVCTRMCVRIRTCTFNSVYYLLSNQLPQENAFAYLCIFGSTSREFYIKNVQVLLPSKFYDCFS